MPYTLNCRNRAREHSSHFPAFDYCLFVPTLLGLRQERRLVEARPHTCWHASGTTPRARATFSLRTCCAMPRPGRDRRAIPACRRRASPTAPAPCVPQAAAPSAATTRGSPPGSSSTFCRPVASATNLDEHAEQRHRGAMLRIDGGTPMASAISRAAPFIGLARLRHDASMKSMSLGLRDRGFQSSPPSSSSGSCRRQATKEGQRGGRPGGWSPARASDARTDRPSSDRWRRHRPARPRALPSCRAARHRAAMLRIDAPARGLVVDVDRHRRRLDRRQAVAVVGGSDELGSPHSLSSTNGRGL